MNEDDNRQASGALRDAKPACHSDLLAVCVAREKLLSEIVSEEMG